MTTVATLDIRPGMDVFNAYQDCYIGSVVSIVRGPAGGDGGAGQPREPIQTGSEGAPANATLFHEQGATVETAPPERRGTRTLGEEMGPVPTTALGNTGPERQSAADQYATHPESQRARATYMAVRPGRINLGPLTRVVYIPIEAVRSLSMERVVVELGGNTIPAQWKTRPTGE